MKGQQFIEWLRRPGGVIVYPPIGELLADAVEEADGSFRSLIECECVWVGERDAADFSRGWWDTSRAIDGVGGDFQVEEAATIARALHYLDRRGLIERKEGEPHMVKFR